MQQDERPGRWRNGRRAVQAVVANQIETIALDLFSVGYRVEGCWQSMLVAGSNPAPRFAARAPSLGGSSTAEQAA